MELLKWIGSILASIMGICLFIGGWFVLAAIGATLGTVMLGGAIVLLVAMGIKEYFEK